jgi:cytochrome c oxidase subunit II
MADRLAPVVRRGAVTRVVLIGIVVGAIATAIAILVPWLPDQGTEQAAHFDFVFWFVTAICITIFSLVASVTVYAVLKFRAKPDDDSDGPPIHGHTGLEIAWTAVPFALVTAIAIVSTVALARSERLPADHMTVEVLAQQFAWRFTYPDQENLSSATLRLPVGVPVELKMTSRDVIHSFFVPEFRVKRDVLPGEETRIVFTPSKIGEYSLACYELCGIGHALMRTPVVVLRRGAFDAWVKRQQGALEGPSGEAGKAVFEEQGCGACHALADAGATANIGPSLDKLSDEADKAGRPLEEFVRESIVNPDAYVEPGFAAGVMPKTFADLPKQQLDALVDYLVQQARKQGGS